MIMADKMSFFKENQRIIRDFNYNMHLVTEKDKDKEDLEKKLTALKHRIKENNVEIRLEYAPEKYIYFSGDKETDWNEVRIICDGLRIKTIINDIIISDFDGSGILDDVAHKEHNVGIKGQIALQLHKYSENEIRFKDIAIREIE
jgi:hypothetical protein